MKIFKTIGFFMGLILIMSIGSILFFRRNNLTVYDKTAVRIKETEIDKEKKDSLDVVFMGDSICYSSFSPDIMEKEYGINSYVCGTSAQRICDTYAILQNVFKNQKPKLVVLEANCLYRNMKTEKDKEDVVKNILMKYFPICEEHSDWKNGADKVLGIKEVQKNNRGFIERKSIKKYTGGEYMEKNDQIENFPMYVNEYFEKIKECCDKNGAKLLLVSSPSPKNWNYGRHNMVQTLAEESNIEYIDLNIDPNVKIDWNTDTKDGGDHLNINGAVKVTDCLGKYLEKMRIK